MGCSTWKKILYDLVVRLHLSRPHQQDDTWLLKSQSNQRTQTRHLLHYLLPPVRDVLSTSRQRAAPGRCGRRAQQAAKLGASGMEQQLNLEGTRALAVALYKTISSGILNARTSWRETSACSPSPVSSVDRRPSHTHTGVGIEESPPTLTHPSALV